MTDDKAFCPGCPRRGVFMALGKLRLVAAGDTTCSLVGARPPRPKPRPDGAGPHRRSGPSGTGAHGSGPHGAPRGTSHVPPEAPALRVSVIEDCSLAGPGVAVLTEIAQMDGGSIGVILNNGLADGDGGAEGPDIVGLCQSLGIERVKRIDPFTISEIAEALREEADARGASVMVVEAPCTVRFEIKNPAYRVDPDICEGCEHCLKVECSAMKVVVRSDGSKQVEIDPGECAGCGICVQLCKHDAIFASIQKP